MNIWLILALIFAVLESYVLWKKRDKLEYVTKPAVMICLFAWLYLNTGLQGLAFWFGLGVLFSLLGDVLLMISLDRLFIPGLVAFLFAQVSYIVGFQNELMRVNVWSATLIVIISVSAVRVMRRIVSALREKGNNRMAIPIVLYATVISVMLYAAMSTISNREWKTSASFFASAGAFLFYISDLILAWNKFVSPIKHGRVLNIAAYHLGQIGLIAGVVSQLGLK